MKDNLDIATTMCYISVDDSTCVHVLSCVWNVIVISHIIVQVITIILSGVLLWTIKICIQKSDFIVL